MTELRLRSRISEAEMEGKVGRILTAADFNVMLTGGDYGQIRNEQGQWEKVHRVAFRLAYGYAPEVVRHTCDHGLCILPVHLLGGTQADNVTDMMSRGRHSAQRDPEAWRTLMLGRKQRDLATYPRGNEHHSRRRDVTRDVAGRFA
jgi:hypothetical protein